MMGRHHVNTPRHTGFTIPRDRTSPDTARVNLLSKARESGWIAAFAALVLALTARAQPAASATKPAAAEADLSPLLAPLLEAHDVPALGAVLVDQGRVAAIGVAGVRQAGDPTPVTTDDLWHIGSCTKAMTATLCAVLVDQGVLSWDTTIGDAFPDEFESPGADPAWKAVTLAHLLTNTGGVPSDLSADGLWAKLWKREGTPTEQRRQLLQGVLAREPRFAPGTSFEYANGGFAIAGHIAEVRTGTAWEDLLRTRVLEPLGIRSAGYGAPGAADTIDQPRGHSATGAVIRPGLGADNPPAIGPAGTVHLSLRDWAAFAALHLAGARGHSTLVSPESFATLHAPGPVAAQPYAMGWLITTRPWAKGGAPGDTGRVLTHSGSNTMWMAVAWLAPERDFAVLVTCNRGGNHGAKATDAAAAAIIKAHKPRPAPPKPADAPAPNPDAAKNNP